MDVRMAQGEFRVGDDQRLICYVVTVKEDSIEVYVNGAERVHLRDDYFSFPSIPRIDAI